MRRYLKALALPILVIGIVWAGTGTAGFDRIASVRGKSTQPVSVPVSKPAAKKAAAPASDARQQATGAPVQAPTPSAAGIGQADKGLAQAIARTGQKQAQAGSGLAQAVAVTGTDQTETNGEQTDQRGGAGTAAMGKQTTAGELTPKQVTQLIESKAAVVVAYRYAGATNFGARDVKIRRLEGGAVVSGRGSFQANRVDYEVSFLGTIADGSVLSYGLDSRDPEWQSFSKARKQKGAYYNTAMISAEGKVGVTELSTQWQNGAPTGAFTIGSGGQKVSSTQPTYNSSMMSGAANRLGGQVQVAVWRKSKC